MTGKISELFCVASEKLKETMGEAKDLTVRAALNVYIDYLKGIGKVLDLKIDPKTKSAYISIELKGEASPISLEITSYQILEKNGKKFLKIGGFKASREWLDVALNGFVKDKEFELDDLTARAMGLIV